MDVMPNYPWSKDDKYVFYRRWVGLMKANALLQQIIIADAKSGQSQWSEKEGVDLTGYLRLERRVLIHCLLLVHVVVGGLAGGAYWTFSRRRRII